MDAERTETVATDPEALVEEYLIQKGHPALAMDQ